MVNAFLGDYEIVKTIGEGALGEVVLAEHRFLKRPYALKVLSADFGLDEEFLHRFEKEVSLLATLDHPNIVKIHTVSEDQGTYFLVTDCVLSDGKSLNLADYLAEQTTPLSEDEIVSIAYQIASALDFAHDKMQDGLPFSHEGLKLSNILVKKEKTGTTVHLSDFGLGRIMGAGNLFAKTYKIVSENLGKDEQELPKLHQAFLHTFLFLAPEQKSPSYHRKNTKTDSYAFGVVVYYLLTQKFPEGIFSLPSELAPHYKLNWDKLIISCLQQDPAKRPGSLKQALEEILNLTPKQSSDSPKPILKPGEILRPQFDADPAAIFQLETTVAKYLPKPQEHKEIAPLLTDMVIIRGGAFYRGSTSGGRDEIPRHLVNLTSFAIDAHPVTNEQFVRFLEAMGGEKDHNNNDIIRLRDSRIKRFGGKLTIESGYARHPVVGVAWYGAVAYAKWVGKRLPTEAEWEVAASSASDDNIYPTGKTIERSQANFFSSDTTAVMSYPPNAFNLYDMAGNVYEWCQDWYDYHYYDISVQEPNNPKGPVQGVYRVLRGGCWKSLKEDMRSSHRHRNNPGTMNGTYGFRCAADVV